MCSRLAFAFGISLLSTGCFDVVEVDVRRTLEIDDFEDGDENASPTSGFEHWYCVSFSTPDAQADPTCGTSPGFESTFGEYLNFLLRELPNVDYPGTLLGTAALGTRDLSSFKSLRFSSKFESGNPAPPEETRLMIELACPSADGASDTWPATRYYDPHDQKEGIALTREWSKKSLLLSDFLEPWWQGSQLDEGSCLERVHAIQFVIVPELSNGEAAAGTLTIDNVVLE